MCMRVWQLVRCRNIKYLSCISEQWVCSLCRARENSGEGSPETKCEFCDQTGGSMKLFTIYQTDPDYISKKFWKKAWCHIYCIDYQPELDYSRYMDNDYVFIHDIARYRYRSKLTAREVCMFCKTGGNLLVVIYIQAPGLSAHS